MFKFKKILLFSLDAHTKMIAIQEKCVELISTIIKLVHQQNRELQNDYICGAWTDRLNRTSLSIYKVTDGYRATIFRQIDGQKRFDLEYFIEDCGEDLRARLVHQVYELNESLPFLEASVQQENIPVEIAKPEDRIRIGSSDWFYRDEVVYSC